MLLDTPAVQLNLHAASYSNGLGGVCEALTISMFVPFAGFILDPLGSLLEILGGCSQGTFLESPGIALGQELAKLSEFL